MKAPRKDAWTDAELQIIYDHIHVKNAARILYPLLPGRTPSTIHNRLSQLRAEAGITVTKPHLPDARARDARMGCQRLAEAIEAELQKGSDGRGKLDG